MNHFHSQFRSLLAIALLLPGLAGFAAIEITVNSTGDQNLPDTDLTLTEAVLYMNQSQGMPALTLGRNLSAAESNQVVTVAGNTSRIKFNIAGAGPHFVTAPPEDSTFFVKYGILASDVVLDGYSQPGASPNTNPILASNNAVLKIVIDARSEPGTTVIGAAGNNVTLRGLSLLGGSVAFGSPGPDPVNFPNLGGKLQGCWIGISPDQSILFNGGSGIWCYQSGGNQVIGTDGDGVNDRNEFNIIIGQEILIGMEADGYATTNCRVSGNFLGVLPDGLTTLTTAQVDALALGESDAFEGAGADGFVFGTDSNGVSDEDERNIIGGMRRSGTGNGDEVFELWGVCKDARIMGNYIGVGVDGVTVLPNKRLLECSAAGTTLQFGSNGDGVRDDIEANIVAGTFNRMIRFGGPTTSLFFRRNSFFENTPQFLDDPINSFNGSILASGDLAVISPVISNSTTRAELVGWVPVSTDAAANNRRAAEIHIYEADSSAAPDRPQGKKWLATYVDNGPQDLDPAANSFRFNICSLPISSTGAKLTVNETVTDDLGGGSSAFAAAYALPDVSNALTITPSGGSVRLTWQMNGVLQAKPVLSSGSWTNVPGCSPVVLPAGSGSLYFRVAQ